MSVEIRKIPGGMSVDGLELKNGKCGCTTVLPCCYSWSKVRRNGEKVSFVAKSTGPDTKDAFAWSYSVQKEGNVVDVSFEDARDKRIFSGFYPPRLEDFLSKGWELVSRTGDREDFGVWRCAACRWLYKEKDQKTPFPEQPDDWKCPVCNAGKESFEQVA